jgi:hypothetical protein
MRVVRDCAAQAFSGGGTQHYAQPATSVGAADDERSAQSDQPQPGPLQAPEGVLLCAGCELSRRDADRT